MKKKVPIVVLERITPIINENRVLLTTLRDEKFFLSVKDSDPNSDLYFKLRQEDSRGTYIIKKKPASESSNFEIEVGFNTLEEALVSFNDWLLILKRYKDIKTIYDDPIVEEHSKHYFQKYKMSDPKADEIPFDFERILLIEEYLQQLSNILEKSKDNLSESQISIIEEVQNDCLNLEEELTSLPQNIVIERISKMLGKLTKSVWKYTKYAISLFGEKFAEKIAEISIEIVSKIDITPLIP